MISNTADALRKSCIAEIVELHHFFQLWMNGELPATEAAFARFLNGTDARFTLIGPDGQSAGRGEVAAWIRAAHGSRAGFRLWTTDHRIHYVQDATIMATYVEWQDQDGSTTSRISTALFRTSASAPNGFAWVHVHETWLEPPTT